VLQTVSGIGSKVPSRIVHIGGLLRYPQPAAREHGLVCRPASVRDEVSRRLMDELSDELERITGDSGRARFNEADLEGDRAVFAVCRYDDEPVGCGGLREMSTETAEFKRIYARSTTRGLGVGGNILSYLEGQAAALGYREVVLATRQVNTNAVSFYLHKGYEVCEGYGVYREVPEAVCFRKEIAS